MIGASNSPLNMFSTASANGPSMYAIGYNGGPGGGINTALNATIDRYHANLDAQNQNAYKIQQIGAESGARVAGDKAIIDYKRQNVPTDPDMNGPQVMKDPTTGKFFYANSTVNDATGGIKKSWTPVTNSPPEDEKKVFENSLYSKINQGISGQNVIQQGANGAVADTPGQQTDKRSQAIQILNSAGKVVNEDTINHVMQQL